MICGGCVNKLVSRVINSSFLARIQIWNSCQKGTIFTSIAKDQLQQIIAENNIASVPDVYSFFKENFKAMLQELLEAEMEDSIGYEKK